MATHNTDSLLPLFVILAVFLCCLQCETPSNPIPHSNYTRADVQIERMEEVEILYSDSAQVRVRITAPKMLRHLQRKDTRQEFTDGIFLEFFDNYTETTGSLRANYAVRHESTRKMIVQDSVVWRSETGDQLETEELIWSEREGKIVTNKFVTITRSDEIIYGYGFEAAQDFSEANIKAVEGRIKITN